MLLEIAFFRAVYTIVLRSAFCWFEMRSLANVALSADKRLSVCVYDVSLKMLCSTFAHLAATDVVDAFDSCELGPIFVIRIIKCVTPRARFSRCHMGFSKRRNTGFSAAAVRRSRKRFKRGSRKRTAASRRAVGGTSRRLSMYRSPIVKKKTMKFRMRRTWKLDPAAGGHDSFSIVANDMHDPFGALGANPPQAPYWEQQKVLYHRYRVVKSQLVLRIMATENTSVNHRGIILLFKRRLAGVPSYANMLDQSTHPGTTMRVIAGHQSTDVIVMKKSFTATTDLAFEVAMHTTGIDSSPGTDHDFFYLVQFANVFDASADAVGLSGTLELITYVEFSEPVDALHDVVVPPPP